MNGQLIPGTLPTNCYPASPQLFYNLMFQLGVVQFPNLTGIIISDSQPAATDRDKGWLKTSGSSPLWPPLFIWFNGAWVMRHPDPPSGDTVRLYRGTLGNLTTYDGGDNNPLGDASGPMWEEYTAAQGRFPLSPGTLPSGLVVAVGATGGEERHTLTIPELPAHTHPPLTTANGNTFLGEQNGGASSTQPVGTGTFPRDATTGSTGGDQPHQNMPPYVGVYQIVRTARVYYRGA